MATEDWSLPGSDNQPIYGTTHLPPPEMAPRGVILICHGFKGYKDYGFIPLLAESASQQGLIAHRFNFSHSGVTPDDKTFARPDLFERDTWGRQIHDVFTVAAAGAAGKLPGNSAPRLPLVWFGHSRGGVTVLLASSRLFCGTQAPSQIDLPMPAGVIAAAAPQSCCSIAPELARRLRRRGYIESPSSRTGQVLRIGKQWLEEIDQDPQAFDPIVAIANVRCPVLLIHGDADQTVPVADAHRLKAAAGAGAQMVIVADASHTFNAPNPLAVDQEPPVSTQRLVDTVCGFASDLCPRV